MRTPKSELARPAPLKPAPRKKRKDGAIYAAPDDVIWWAQVNQRPPFISAARQIAQLRKAGVKDILVIWGDDNTMTAERA